MDAPEKIVLHILNTGTFSGAENVVISLIRAMKRYYPEKYRFIYVALRGSIEESLRREQIEFFLMDKISLQNLITVRRKYAPDVVHAHDFTTSIVAGCVFDKGVVISHLHNNPPWIKGINLKSILYMLFIARYKRILLVSSAMEKEYVFRSILQKKMMILQNVVDSDRLNEMSCGESKGYDVVFLGRLSEQKDPLLFIDIIYHLSQLKHDVRAAMIGDGELKDMCKERIKRYGLENNICMLGFLENPYPVLKGSKILCATSRWEGFGLMAVEAMALGVPVLATGAGALKNIVTPECGKLCRTAEEFAESACRLLDEEELWKKLSKGAVRRSAIYSDVASYCGKLDTIYQEIVGQY